eukprot:snap_masked-scaffold_58-processed-gene-0.54-mRNA-1 protein AED:1.00 eAED:1.00 QI:0/-1/0/0/-1/1/1/0/908
MMAICRWFNLILLFPIYDFKELYFSVTYRDFLPSACLFKLGDEKKLNGLEIFKDIWEINKYGSMSEISSAAKSRCDVLLLSTEDNKFKSALEEGEISGHPDFELQFFVTASQPCSWDFPSRSCINEGNRTNIGLVKSYLIPSHAGIPKPVYCSDTERCGLQDYRVYNQKSDNLYTQSNKEYFDLWYRDNRTFNRRVGKTLKLSSEDGISFVYDSFFDDDFFGPLNEYKSGTNKVSTNTDVDLVPAWPQSFVNQRKEKNLDSRNFWFTTEIHSFFQYNSSATMVFDFSGDDDFFAYINGKLAIDVGGLHGIRHGTINLNREIEYEGKVQLIADILELVDGEIYTLDIFHAERQTVASNFKVTTNLFPACNVIQSGSQRFLLGALSKEQVDDTFFKHPQVAVIEENIILQSNTYSNGGWFIYTRTKENVGRGFKVKFVAKVLDFARGFAFVVQSDTLDEYPISTGQTFNLRGLENVFAVVFDFCADGNFGNCRKNTVSVLYENSKNATQETKNIFSISNETVQTFEHFYDAYRNLYVEVVYYASPSFLEVYINNSLYLREANFNIAEILGSLGAHVGFTSAASFNTQGNVQISNWSLETVEVDPIKTELLFNSENLTFQSFYTGGEYVLKDISVQTRDSCENLIDSGTLAEWFQVFFYRVITVEIPKNNTYKFNRNLEIIDNTTLDTVNSIEILDGAVVDNENGTYSFQITAETSGEYFFAFVFGMNCTIQVENLSDEFRFIGDNCFSYISPEPIVAVYEEEVNITDAPTVLEDPTIDSETITLVSSTGGILLGLSFVSGCIMIGYKKRWYRDKEYVKEGNAYKLHVNTNFDATEEYNRLGRKLFRTRQEIVELEARQNTTENEIQIQALKQENLQLKKTLYQQKRNFVGAHSEETTYRFDTGRRRKKEF